MGSNLQEEEYIDALLADLAFELISMDSNREISSVFLGGGTPSLFSAGSMEKLLTTISDRIAFAGDVEITMEANPGATEYADLPGYLSAGINRLSLGAQSFDPQALQSLGRIHSPKEISTDFNRARKAGFSNINLDLMYGLPGQDIAGAEKDLQQALSLEPDHLSLYQLTLEPNTVFHRYPPQLPDDDALWSMQENIINTATRAGFERYEVSAFAREGRQCRHNLNYWQFGDYIGLGAGAHGKLTTAHEGVVRRSRKRHPGNFMTAAGTGEALAGEQKVDREDLVFEFLLNALRLKNGFSLSMAQTHTGIPGELFLDRLGPAIHSGLVQQEGERVACTFRGYLFLDSILSSLLPEEHETL